MPTYSLSDLGTRVLRDIGLVAPDEIASSDDQGWAEETAISEISLLAAIGLPIWNGSELAVPQEYLTILSRRIGLAVAPSFGLMSLADAQMAMREAERYLTTLANPHGGTPGMLRTNDAKPRRLAPNFTLGT